MTYPHVFSVPGIADFAHLIEEERRRQIEKFGPNQSHPDRYTSEKVFAEDMANIFRRTIETAIARDGRITWSLVLLEEVMEAISAENPKEFQVKIIQVAAVCAAILYDWNYVHPRVDGKLWEED